MLVLGLLGSRLTDYWNINHSVRHECYTPYRCCLLGSDYRSKRVYALNGVSAEKIISFQIRSTQSSLFLSMAKADYTDASLVLVPKVLSVSCCPLWVGFWHSHNLPRVFRFTGEDRTLTHCPGRY